MAIAWDNALSLGSSTAGSLTVSYTMGAVSNGYLVGGVASNTTTEVVTAIKYAGVSLTEVAYATHGAGASSWWLANPASGANNVVVTANAGTLYWTYVSSYSGVDPNAPEAFVTDTTSTATPGNPAPNVINPAITTVSDNAWIETIAYGPGWLGTSTDGSVRAFDSSGGIIVDKGPNTPAGSYTIDYDTAFSGGTNIVGVTIALKPFSAVAFTGFYVAFV